jgi:phosphatidylglycerophosphate synthase
MTKKQYTSHDVRQSYSSEQKIDEMQTQWITYILYRPISFRLTPLLLNLEVTPNQLGMVNLILSLCLPAAAFLPFETGLTVIMVIVFISALFDAMDGDIARAGNMTSIRGQYFDFVTDQLHKLLAYAAIALLLIHNPDRSQLLYPGIMCVAAAWLTISARLNRDYSQSLRGTGTSDYKRAAQDKDLTWFDYVFFGVSALEHILPFALLAVLFFGHLDWVVWWVLFYAALDFVFTQITAFSKLPRPTP